MGKGSRVVASRDKTNEESSRANPPPDVKVLVTAFGPFGGRSRNASSLALAGLKQQLPWINTRILPVDHKTAPMRMSRALRELHPDTVLMLGEAGGARRIRFETMAWNEMDFRIPDNAGNQPQNQLIDPDASPGMASTLPFAEVHQRLLEKGHECEISTDPGRYLCNQILFHTLRHLEKHRPHVKAGFIHLPLETECPTPNAVEALTQTIGLILRL
jgi:pyroglutamyl-peptidase